MKMANAALLMKMDKQLLEQFKKDLEAKKKKVEGDLESIAKKDTNLKGDYDTKFPDFGAPQSTDEEALEVAAYENTLPIEYALEMRLAGINKALEKIEKGDYGKCEKCGEPIDEKRLKIMPEATACAKCHKK